MTTLRRLALLLLLVPGPVFADWSCQSGTARANLLELYTSQGCSSCPPADRWLSALGDSERLWTDVVPVAWHVTYWDYIGWRDPFARSDNDRRQRDMAAAARAQVYTPGMFLNRTEYRAWRRHPPVAPDTGRADTGVLSAAASGAEVTVTFKPAAGLAVTAPRVELVYLRSGEHTAVAAGENRGRDLRNDFVAGPLSSADMEDNGRDWTANLQARPHAESEAVAVWVTDRGRVLQATGAWLNRESPAQIE